MKRSIYSGMRVVLATAAATVLAGITLTGCMSSGESTDAGVAVEAPAENGETAANEATTNDASNVSGVENAEAPAENAAGGELQNLVNEGSANAAGAPSDGAAANAEAAGNDPFAAALNNATAPADNTALNGEAPVNGNADPFAPPPEAAPVADAGVAPADASLPPADAVPAESVASAPDAAIPPAPDASGAAVSALPEGGLLPEFGSKMSYFIKKGDTLAKIAAMIYGDASKWQTLAEENNIKNASLIYAGDVILYTLSEKSQGFASKYEAAPRTSFKVTRGDTLSSLAQKVFGSQGEWRSLWKMNPQVKNPDLIKEGMVLVYRDTAKVAATDTEEEVLVGMN